jgi:hypothetical protein
MRPPVHGASGEDAEQDNSGHDQAPSPVCPVKNAEQDYEQRAQHAGDEKPPMPPWTSPEDE